MTPMVYLDHALEHPAYDLALDEALLLTAEAGKSGEVLRVWERPSPAVVLGAGGKLSEEVNEAACIADNVPILRRSSGGGTVLLGPGCLCYSLVLRYDRSAELSQVRSSFRFILGRVVNALGVEGATVSGISDLALDGLKFSGNSQQRKRDYLLHHGTVLYDLDLSRITRYLPVPPRQPDYRQGRAHDDFVQNVPLDAQLVRRRLRAVWGAVDVCQQPPLELAHMLARDRYSLAEWVRRR